MSHGLTCVFCGTKGGFANELIIFIVDGTGIVECTWCSAGARISRSA